MRNSKTASKTTETANEFLIPAAVERRRRLLEVIGSAIIDDAGESQVIDRIAAVTQDLGEREAALDAWRGYVGYADVAL